MSAYQIDLENGHRPTAPIWAQPGVQVVQATPVLSAAPVTNYPEAIIVTSPTRRSKTSQIIWITLICVLIGVIAGVIFGVFRSRRTYYYR